MRKGVIFILVLAILVLAGIVYLLSFSSFNQTRGVSQEPRAVKVFDVVDMASSGFSPSIITIKHGGKVSFVNTDTKAHWPATDVHPTHTLYPGSGITKCGTAEELTIFDACRGVAPESTYQFIFNEKGTWRYHDHLNPNLKGTIIVS